MKPQVACPVCASTRSVLYLDDCDKELDGTSFGSSRTNVSHGRIVRCRNCGCGYRSMRPNPEELGSLYRRLDARVYHSESKGRLQTARRHYGIVQRFISSGAILDVGCGSGLFLRQALDQGWRVCGVEPSEELCRFARETVGDGAEIICSTLEDASLCASFDAISIWDVLEHVPDPCAFMRACSSLLKPGGYLFLNVPDLDSLPARLLGRRWPLLLPEHLSYFNRKTIRLCGQQAGLLWQACGRRPSSFSVDYVLYRLAQHNINGTQWLHRMIKGRSLGSRIISLPLGELYAVWRRPPQCL